MKNPKISVIIPVYNTEKYIRQCIESVINQSFQEIEIIIVNDCSPDNSYLIIDQFQKIDNRIKVINNERNLGLGGSRNVGMDYASGDYIAFVDSDDWIEIDTLDEAYKALLESQSDIVFYRYYKYYEKPGFAQPVKSLKNKLKLKRDIFTLQECPRLFDITSACMKIYKKKIIDKYLIYFPTDLYYEDVPFSFKFYLHMHTATLIDKPFYYYRQHEGTITKDNSAKMLDIFNVIKIADDYILGMAINPQILTGYTNKKWNLLFSILSRIETSSKKEYFTNLTKVKNDTIRGDYFIPRLLLKIRLLRLLSFYISLLSNLNRMKFRAKRILTR